MLMTCRLRLVRRRPRPLGHDSGSSRAWRGALVRQRPLHRRLVWRRRGLWRRHEIRHELTVVAAIRRLITVLSQRCTDVGVGVGPCYRVQPSLRIPRRRWHVPACTVHAVPRVMGRRGRTPMLRCRSESGGGSGRGVSLCAMVLINAAPCTLAQDSPALQALMSNHGHDDRQLVAALARLHLRGRRPPGTVRGCAR